MLYPNKTRRPSPRAAAPSAGCKMQMVIKMLMRLEHLDPITSVVGGTGQAPTAQFRRIAISTWEGRRRSLSEHEAIASALRRRDLTAYTAALRQHTESCDMACREGLRKLRGQWPEPPAKSPE